MKDHSQIQLEGDLEDAFALYLSTEVMGAHWLDLAETLAKVVHAGELSLEQAARIDHLLRCTRGGESPSCMVCGAHWTD